MRAQPYSFANFVILYIRFWPFQTCLRTPYLNYKIYIFIVCKYCNCFLGLEIFFQFSKNSEFPLNFAFPALFVKVLFHFRCLEREINSSEQSVKLNMQTFSILIYFDRWINSPDEIEKGKKTFSLCWKFFALYSKNLLWPTKLCPYLMSLDNSDDLLEYLISNVLASNIRRFCWM